MDAKPLRLGLRPVSSSVMKDENDPEVKCKSSDLWKIKATFAVNKELI